METGYEIEYKNVQTGLEGKHYEVVFVKDEEVEE